MVKPFTPTCLSFDVHKVMHTVDCYETISIIIIVYHAVELSEKGELQSQPSFEPILCTIAMNEQICFHG